MFLHMDLHLDYWNEHGTIELMYVQFEFSTRTFYMKTPDFANGRSRGFAAVYVEI